MIDPGGRTELKLVGDYENLSIEEIVGMGIVPKEITAFCEAHNCQYNAKPLSRFFDSVVYTSCPKCEEERKTKREKENRERKEAKRRENFERYLSKLKARGCDFDYIRMVRNGVNPSIDTELLTKKLPNIDLSVSSLLAYDKSSDDFVINANVAIFGGCGIGKSFLAYRLVDIALQNGKCYLCREMSEISSIYRNGFEGGFRVTNSVDNLREFIDGVDCLIIDEIDSCISQKEKDSEVISHIIKLCKFNGVRLIIIGNCNKAEFLEVLEEKVKSRLAGALSVGGWNMKDLRREK